MILTTISKNGISSFSLPQKIKGQYWLYKIDDSEPLIGVEGINDTWILRSNKHVKIYSGESTYTKSIQLSPGKIFLLSKDDEEKIVVFTEETSIDRQIFSKYLIRNNTAIKIGKAGNNDIVYGNPYVSGEHATLIYKDNRWILKDNNSTNGTFVNNRKVLDNQLLYGDTIFIMGLKIIVGKNFIALNNPDGLVKITTAFDRFVPQRIELSEDDEDYVAPEEEYFFRSPRFKRDVETYKLEVDGPPNSPITEEMPVVLVMGSSMAMGMMSMVTLTNAVITGNVLSGVMGGSMLASTLLLPTITKKYEKNRKKRKEETRQKRYREYLNDLSARITEQGHLQKEIIKENIVTIEDCEKRIENLDRNLWERAIGQNDFLRVRVGMGDGILDVELNYPKRKFQLENDNLQEEMLAFCEKTKTIRDIPISYSLFDNFISGIIGDRNVVVEFAKGLIIQLAALYSYDETKFIFLYDESEENQFGFVKWLPHVWNDEKSFRFIANNPSEAKEVSAYLENIIAVRQDMNENDLPEEIPYYIIFSFSRDLAARMEAIKQILSKKQNLNISILTVYDDIKNLPKECSMVVELKGGQGRLFDKNDISGKHIDFIPDIMPNRDPMYLSRKLSNVALTSLNSNYQLPSMITFLQMFGVGKVEHLNALTRWKENDPTKSLEAEVGIDTLGGLFKLDLHEKFHGPHGLVAGMTGSGKSEFIITYILSLAVNYHPEEVAFILIDYKGGGMAKSFERLPHTAGIITNLDGASIKRSLVSIESELKRRQAIFAEASKKVGVSNIDIYKYQKLYRDKTVTEPLQHLFIISDEFAELKTQQPEFMAQLVSAARIGRSLGVHLILATQKPSGVVDDQIWSNSKFRVCLKVQERADSMDMLKRPDAAELKETGRFYLQVGYNELFELGQSAWAGAPYYPSDKVVVEKDNSVLVVDTNGHVIKQVKLEKKKSIFESEAKKQLDVITEYLRETAEEEGIKIKPLWLEPIAPVIVLDDIRKKYNIQPEKYVLNPLIGEFDDPAHQRQSYLRLPITREGNTIIYGTAGSGKTSFLNAMICSLMTEHTPDEVNIYILDFASETMKVFAKAPHVGDVVFSYEAEKISNLFKMLKNEADRRKKVFSEFGGDYSSYINNSGVVIPQIVVVINNFAAFTETYQEKEEAIAFLSREGTKYGIYFVLTALGTGAIRFRLLQNFKQLLVLQLNDESDYSNVVGKTEGLYPSRHKGRGLIRTDALYEFQIASLVEDGIPFEYIKARCSKLGMEWTGETAKKIPILPDTVDEDFLSEYIKESQPLNVPIGVEKSTLNIYYYPFEFYYITLIESMGEECNVFMGELARFLGKYVGLSGMAFDIPKNISGGMNDIEVCRTAKECESGVEKLFDTVLYRNNTYKTALENGEEPEKFEQMIVLINSISSLRSVLSNEQLKEKLSLILEKGSINYKINIIIAEQSKNISSMAYEKWFKNNVTTDGIWLGNGITDQYQIKANKSTPDMYEDLTHEFALSILKGKCAKIKKLGQIIGDINE